MVRGLLHLTRPADPPAPRYLRPSVGGRVGGEWHEATADLSFLETPREELHELGLRGVNAASAGWLGLTITGATEA